MALRQTQLHFFESALPQTEPPSTRYQGSKLKILPWIWETIGSLKFQSVLDAFGGTASVSYLLKTSGKAVTYNDYLKFNWFIATALIENSQTRLSEPEIDFVLSRDPYITYDDFIYRTFRDIYFTDEENQWLDTVCQNIPRLGGRFQRALAYYALFQACIVKRPYNLFHRKNLYMRTAEVERTFGNKSTWDTPFEEHFRTFAAEANAAIFDSRIPCRALCGDALQVPGHYDLVYVDPPYVSTKGVGVDYFDFYHFLEGMVDYTAWNQRIDYGKKHRPLKGPRSPWSYPQTTRAAFERLFERYADSILVISYRSDGIPSEEQIISLLQHQNKTVQRHHFGQYKYALSTNGVSKEVVIIAT
jgi:adenine-specific DNA methylase